MPKWIRSLIALGGTATLLACFHGTKPVDAPDAATLVFDTDPQSVRVQMVKQPSAPLTVDWSMQDRKALEARVHQRGAIVVRFDERSLQPLPDCRPQGAYVFTGVTHGRELIGARTTAELAANFPLTAVRLGARYAEAEQLTADLHVVGMANLDRPIIPHAEVQSPACRGATHVVTEITHGGFRFGSARQVDVEGRANVGGVGGGAGMTGSADRLSEDGDVVACKRATWKDVEPPAECGGVIRIRLVPIETKDTKEASSACPAGLRWTGSGCVSEQLAVKSTGQVDPGKLTALPEPRSAAATFACDRSRPAECYTQCVAGNADSCSRLGTAFVLGAGVPKDAALGQKLVEISCRGGSSDGCFQAGILAIEQKRFRDGLEWSARSCQMGDPAGCTNEAYVLWRGLGGTRRDPQRAFELFARACNRRDFVSCNNAGVMLFFDTTGTLRRNAGLACKMFGQSCEAGQNISCANLGICFEHGIDRPRDLDLAFKYYATACDAGAGFGCVWGGLLLEEARRGDPKAVRVALQQYEATCARKNEGLNSCVSNADIRAALPGRYSDDMIDRHACDGGLTEGLACYNAALIHERGLAGPPNLARASQLLRRACTDFDVKKACRAPR